MVEVVTLWSVDPLRALQEEIERWMVEQPRQLVEAPQFDSLVALAEHFHDLTRSVQWLRPYFDGVGLSDAEFEATTALMAIATGASHASPAALGKRQVPGSASASFTHLWTSGFARHPDTTAVHVAGGYLSGLWAPKGRQPTTTSWEPARLLLKAMACKLVRHGLHELVRLGMDPLADERRRKRMIFNRRVVQAADAVVVALFTAEADRRLAAWDCEVLGLWAFLADAILGPGKRRPNECPGARPGLAKRPQPGAFHKCHFGRWARDAVGITVGSREIHVCSSCRGVHDEPRCETNPEALVFATYREHMFVTPKDRLTDSERQTGWTQVRRSVCKNDLCVERLRSIWTTCQGAQPIYALNQQPCPYCGASGQAGQRPITVWTRFP